MKLIYKGKTKDVYELEDGNYLLKFKDDVTGAGGQFDPGSNSVGHSIAGIGHWNLRLSEHFFKKFDEAGIPSHFIAADHEKAEMTVLPAKPFGNGIEFICRYRAVGSFLRRYGMYVSEGQELGGLVETTVKDDAREDPPITREALEILGIMRIEEYGLLRHMTKEISNVVKRELRKKSLDLYDIKLEHGRIGENVALIDEISGGNMRVYKNGQIIDPLKLAQLILGYNVESSPN